jgi:tripartite-type tricarboxylate transporter receptor subunit TctC
MRNLRSQSCLHEQTSGGFRASSCCIHFAAGLWAQDYPGKPVRIVTTTVGGGSDMIARVTAQGIKEAGIE